MENADLNILAQWAITSFWNYIYVLCFAVILSIQIIFLCGFERKRYGNKNKTKTQEIISAENDNKPPPVKAEPNAAAVAQPPQYDPPQLSLCPEDTLHDVTSIAMDNETTFYMLSPDFSRTALTHSIKDTRTELAQSPCRQTST